MSTDKNQTYFDETSTIDNDTINVREEVEKYLTHWSWFVLGIIVSMGIAYTYLRYSEPTYKAKASILIKDNKKSGLSTELEAFKDLGIVGGSSVNNTDNEIEILKSRKVIGNVVDTLDLGIKYFTEGRVIKTEVHRRSSPFQINFIKKNSILKVRDTAFKIVYKDVNSFNFLSTDGSYISTHNFGEIISNKLGILKVLKTNSIKELPNEVLIRLRPRYKVIDRYRSKIKIAPVNKNSSVLILSLEDAVKEKAEDILNELVKQYNLDAINDKNQVSQKTIEFINVRLKTIGNELANIDDSVKKFKNDKDFTGLPVEAQIVLQSLKETNQKIIENQTNLSLSEWIENKLTSESSKYDLLPVNIGLESASIGPSIVAHNVLITQRNKTKVNAGSKNPILVQLESQIENSRISLLKSLSNLTKSIELTLKELKKEEDKVLSKIKSIPDNERGFIDITRQQEIYASLYSYLLQKKEETDISLAVTVPNAKIIDVAYGSNYPVSPKRNIIFFFALSIGIIVPFLIIYILDLLDTKIHSQKDLEEELNIPYLGDIPKDDSKEKIVIGNGVRSSSAEAFRLIRTNLDFILANKNEGSKTIFITSTISGEGKSYISLNLAASLAVSGKRILLIGMDLRAPKITEYLGLPERKGVTNFITDTNLKLDELKFKIPQVETLDIISSGVIPPNPAELLMTKRVDDLFSKIKSQYDYVVVDTAPVNLVTDTLLIAKYADMFAYTIRANYLDKRLLTVPNRLYKEKRLPNMTVILNDTDPKKSYGYGYGGYGYGYVVVEKPWYKKIFNRS